MAHEGVPLTLADLRNGSEIYERREPSAGKYWEALQKVSQSWPDMKGVAEGLRILLHSWNWRHFNFDCHTVAIFLENNRVGLEEYKGKDIFSFEQSSDGPQIARLFNGLLDALKTPRARSPVGVAKSLQLLAPSYFPLWDYEISKHYGFFSGFPPTAASDYLGFMTVTGDVLRRIVESHSRQRRLLWEEARQEIETQCSLGEPTKSLLKIFDEYNYCKYTKRWIT